MTAAKAILVTSTRALTDVLGATTVYVRPDGVRVGTGAEVVQAMNGSSVAPATIESAVTQHGDGSFADGSYVWTGVARQGTGDKDTCRDWTSAAATDTGTIGGLATGWVCAGSCGNFACNSWTGVFLQCAEQ